MIELLLINSPDLLGWVVALLLALSFGFNVFLTRALRKES